jgi:hypothetical protein
MSDEVREFWDAFERETGEKIEAKGMGAWREGDSASSELWGLLVVTEAAFHFRHLPSQNWLSGLFTRAGKDSVTRKPVSIRIARGDVLDVGIPERSFLGRLFSPPYEIVQIRFREEGAGEASTLRFSVDRVGSLIAALRGLAADSPGSSARLRALRS